MWNDATIYLALQTVVYVGSGFLVWRKGGIQSHLPLLFLLAVGVLFLTIAPLAYYYRGETNFHGTDITAYQIPVFRLYSWALLSIIVGYWSKYFWKKPTMLNEISLPKWLHFSFLVPFQPYAVLILYFGCLAGLFLDVYLAMDASPWEILNPFHYKFGGTSYQYEPFSGGLNSLTDTIIVALLFLYAGIGGKKWYLWPLILFAIYTLLLFGFRYQIFLFIVAAGRCKQT
jgi:hypothetical protein